MVRIELTSEIEKAITMACPLAPNENKDCFGHCALAGVCLEYWTGDNSANKNENIP